MADAVATPTTPVPAAPGTRPPALRAHALGKRVALPSGELVILQDIGFDIAPGDVVAIVGASGSGKSTLLSLLAGLDTPSDGSVELDGEAISTLDEDGRAGCAATRSVSCSRIPAAVADRAGERDAAAGAARRCGCRIADADAAEGRLGERLEHYPKQLSGGEQQRVALARAFVTQPSLLFADEPTGNLDTHTGQAIIDLLFAMNQEAGTTLVLVTHDDHLATRCNRLLRLDGGRLVADQLQSASSR